MTVIYLKDHLIDQRLGVSVAQRVRENKKSFAIEEVLKLWRKGLLSSNEFATRIDKAVKQVDGDLS